MYIRGEDNTVADALSRVAPNAFPDEDAPIHPPYAVWSSSVNAVLSVTTDTAVLADIIQGYKVDTFCKKVVESGSKMKGVHEANGLWYIGDHLLVP